MLIDSVTEGIPGGGVKLVGVIDWGDVSMADADAAVDLSSLFTFFPPSAYGTFLEAYGPVDETRLRLAKMRATWRTIYDCSHALSTKNETLKREGRRAVRYLTNR